jgi:cation transport regulator
VEVAVFQQGLEIIPSREAKSLPRQARDIYEEIYRSAREHYQRNEARRDNASLEETAHRIAWNAVKQLYTLGERSGEWQKLAWE